MKRFALISTLLFAMLAGFTASAQNAVEANKLFKYPTAPNTIKTLENRCNYIVQHFWDNYDITKPVKNDSLFEVAFRDYIDFFQYANFNVVMSSIRDLMFKAQGNENNLKKLGEIAERTLYNTDSEYFNDEVYQAFAQALLNDKRIKGDLRDHYKQQVEKISKNARNAILDDLELTLADGSKKKLSQIMNGEEVTLLFFNDDGDDSAIARLRLGTDIGTNKLIDAKQVLVISVTPCPYSGTWVKSTADYPKNWVVACYPSTMRELDVRVVPGMLILGKDRKILNKNISVDSIMNAFNSAN